MRATRRRPPVAVIDRPQAGLPRLDRVDDWPGTVLVSTLGERAETMAARNAGPALDMSASPPEGFPPVTAYGPGDTVTIRAVTPLLPGGLDFDGRLLGVEVNAGAGHRDLDDRRADAPGGQPRDAVPQARPPGHDAGQVFRSGPLEHSEESDHDDADREARVGSGREL